MRAAGSACAQREPLRHGRDAEHGRARPERGAADVRGAVAVAVGLDDRPELGALERAQERARVAPDRAEIDRELRSGHLSERIVRTEVARELRDVAAAEHFAAGCDPRAEARSPERRQVGDEQARAQACELLGREQDVTTDNTRRTREGKHEAGRPVHDPCLRADRRGHEPHELVIGDRLRAGRVEDDVLLADGDVAQIVAVSSTETGCTR